MKNYINIVVFAIICTVSFRLSAAQAVRSLSADKQKKVNEALIRAGMLGSWNSDYRDIINTLLQKGAQINVVDECGETLLHKMVVHGYRVEDIQWFLLKPNIEVDARNIYGETPLIKVSKFSDSLDICVALINADADPDIVDEREHSFRMINPAFQKNPAIIGAIENYMKRKAERQKLLNHNLLNEVGVGMASDTEDSMLARWVRMDNFLVQGAQVNACTECGHTVLHLMMLWGDLEDIEYWLYKKLYTTGIDVNAVAPGDKGNTPLHKALQWNRSSVDILAALVRAGADQDTVNDERDSYRTLTFALVKEVPSIFGEKLLSLPYKYGCSKK